MGLGHERGRSNTLTCVLWKPRKRNQWEAVARDDANDDSLTDEETTILLEGQGDRKLFHAGYLVMRQMLETWADEWHLEKTVRPTPKTEKERLACKLFALMERTDKLPQRDRH